MPSDLLKLLFYCFCWLTGTAATLLFLAMAVVKPRPETIAMAIVGVLAWPVGLAIYRFFAIPDDNESRR